MHRVVRVRNALVSFTFVCYLEKYILFRFYFRDIFRFHPSLLFLFVSLCFFIINLLLIIVSNIITYKSQILSLWDSDNISSAGTPYTLSGYFKMRLNAWPARDVEPVYD